MKPAYHMKACLPRLLVYAFVLTCIDGCAMLYRDLQPPDVRIAGVTLAGIDNQLNVRLRARLQLDNPNNAPIPVRGGRARLTLNGMDIGEAQLDDRFDLPANGTEVIDLPATLSMSKALSAGLTVLSNGAPELAYRVTGHIDLGVSYLGRVSFDESGRIPLTAN